MVAVHFGGGDVLSMQFVRGAIGMVPPRGGGDRGDPAAGLDQNGPNSQ